MTARTAQGDRVPDRPRLCLGVCAFRDGDDLVVRSVAGAFRIDPAHRAAMQRLLGRLDGDNDLAALLGGEPPAFAFYALRMLGWFAQCGLVAEGRPPASARRLHDPPPGAVAGRPVVLSGRGALADALLIHLRTAGACVRFGTAPTTGAGAVLVSCLDAPDLACLDALDRTARADGSEWLPVFPFGDAVVVGPRVAAGHGPCLGCFERRWLGISPSIALERAYLADLRRGGWRRNPPLSAGEIADLGESIAHAVRRAVDAPDGECPVTLLRRDDGEIRSGSLVAHPLCERCGGPAPEGAEGTPDWFEPAIPLAALWERIRGLADGPCALARLVPRPGGRPVRDAGLPAVAVSRFAIPEPDSITGRQANWCHGSAASAAEAETLAVVEALERYAGLQPGDDDLVAPFSAVAERAIRPTALTLFSRAQYATPGFPFRPFDPREPVRWSRGHDLTRGRPVLVPATAARYGRDDGLLGETSSGVAAHSGRGQALLNGALELIERDAFMIFWLHRLAPPRIDPRHVAGAPRAMLAAVEAAGYAVRLLDLTLDLDIPVCLAAGFRQDGRAPALIVGAGASLDPGVALARALKELDAAALNPTAAWRLGTPLAPEDVVDIEDHARAYEHPDWLPHAAFLWSSPAAADPDRWRPGTDDAASLPALIARLGGHGLGLIGVDITPAAVGRRGLRVVRAIVPGLQPLGFGKRIRLGGRRLYEVPQRMGLRAVPCGEADLNPAPHCFP